MDKGALLVFGEYLLGLTIEYRVDFPVVGVNLEQLTSQLNQRLVLEKDVQFVAVSDSFVIIAIDADFNIVLVLDAQDVVSITLCLIDGLFSVVKVQDQIKQAQPTICKDNIAISQLVDVLDEWIQNDALAPIIRLMMARL